MHKIVSAVRVEKTFSQHSSAAHGNGTHPLNRNVLPRRKSHYECQVPRQLESDDLDLTLRHDENQK